MSPPAGKITSAAEDKKNEILNTALRLFAEHGYHSTTLDAVAREMNISKAAIYYYFKSKEEIIKAILDISANRMDLAIGLKDADLPTIIKLRRFIEYHIEFSADTADLARVAFDQINVLPKKTRDPIKLRQRKVDHALQDILQQGVDEGTIFVDDVKIASYAILGMCNWAYHWYRQKGRMTPTEIAKVCIDLVENGYLLK